MTAESIKPGSIRFIKLGEKGKWEREAIEQDDVIRLDYVSNLHLQCLSGDWNAVLAHWQAKRNGNATTAKNDIRQIRDFYEMPDDTLWFTIFRRHLWWCFAKGAATELQDGSRVRQLASPWRSSDIFGTPLMVQNLDGRLTKVVGYRGTICTLDPAMAEYLIRRINGSVPKEVEVARANVVALLDSVKDLIRGLWWKDFELLVDLVFAKSGWQRVSVLGQTDKAIDLDLEAPVTNRKAFVQVKSQADISVLEESIMQYRDMGIHNEFFFVVHTAPSLTGYESNDSSVHVLDIERLASLVVGAGLVEWLIGKRS